MEYPCTSCSAATTEPCFFGEEDYFSYLHWLAEALKETRCSPHAYALMTNHVHLLLTPKKAATVPKRVSSLGRRYVPYINRHYRRTGHCGAAATRPH